MTRTRPAMRWMSALLWAAVLFSAATVSFAQTTETPFAIAEVEADLPIPDDDSLHGATSVIRIPGAGNVESLEVALDVDHPAPEQLRILLFSPSGERALLHNQQPAGEQPFRPIYETQDPAAESLSRFLNQPAQGDWTLQLFDLIEGTTGTLDAWGLRYQPVSLATPPLPTPVPVSAGMFVEHSRISMASPANALERADFNNDGLDDLAVLTPQNVQVWLSNGNGLQDFPLVIQVENAQRAAVGDLNSDQRPDLVVATQAGPSAATGIRVYLANAAGGFTERFQAKVSLTTALEALALLDVNEDGRLDLIVGGIPQLFTGNGDGAFQLQGLLVDLAWRFLGHADLDEDGHPEMLVVRSRGGTSTNRDPFFIPSSPDLTFLQRTALSISGDWRTALPANIVDPAQRDLAVISDTGEVEPTLWFSRLWMENDQPRVEEKRLAAGSLAFPIEAFDLNVDGLSELVFPATHEVRAFQRTDSPLGGVSERIFAASDAVAAMPGRFFRNGVIGLAVADANGNLILGISTQNTAPTPTPTVPQPPTPTPRLFPPVGTPVPTSTPTPTPAPTPRVQPDINGDGIVDVHDLLILKQYWGQRIPE